MDYYSQFLKKKILKTRLIGIFSSLIGLSHLMLYYFGLMNHWLCAVMICYIIAINFLINSTYQEIFSGIKLSRLNLAIAVLFLLGTIALIVYAIISGNLAF